ncbi:MAG: Serine/threonine-protein kinase tel1 [Caeruleum heppii]|nr:MAG: Serine/threonine-protein kinase tel1 [Caeruleum heppii]
MAEVNINDAIDLKHILVRNRNNQSLDVLKDKGYHKIYEALFRAASIEKSIYIKATRPLVKSQSATRLSACAAVLRPAVEAGVRVLKQRTVRALIGHIIETLPLADGGFCEPLATDYPKTLRILLEYQPHVEHLPTEEWQRIAGFCEQSIRRPLEATAVGRIVPNIDSSSGSPWTLLSNGSSNGLTQSRSDEVTSRLSKTDAEEPILCLEQLLSASNAPVAEQAADLISSLISFLQASTAVSRVHQATFAALNLLLSRIATDQVDIPLQAIKQLLPLIRRFWDTRSAFFREEMLATLILHQTHIAKLLQIDADQQVRIEVEKLMDCLHDEYVKRNEREQLQLDDLIFLDSHNVPFAQPYIQPHGLALRINISRAQRAWAVLALSATLMSLLDAHSSSLDKPHPRGKRLRVGKQLEDCLRQARNADRLKRLFSLAVLSFRLGNNVSEESGPLDLLDVLKICSSDEDGSIASWALLATAR